MQLTNKTHRLGVRSALAYGMLATLLAVFPITTTQAVEVDAEYLLTPHCIDTEGTPRNDDWALGPIPSPGIVVQTGEGGGTFCDRFAVEDPQTLKTNPLRVGDILDIDLVIINPSEQNIKRARVWLAYDPNILNGDLIEINPEFPVTTPGEDGIFDGGYAKMAASAEGKGPDGKKVLFARLQFTILKAVKGGTVITFHNVQPGGHTEIISEEAGTEATVLKEEPGVLHVILTEDTSGDDDIDDLDDLDDLFDEIEDDELDEEDEEDEPEGDQCSKNDDCPSGLCIGGICEESSGAKVENGSACTFNEQCQSGLCASGICVPSLAEQLGGNEQKPERTAFSLLQVRNLRATTEGTAIYLAWDHLQSSALKAYNVYYGTTSGRYIQRRTIPDTSNSLTIRNLIEGTRYYMAVRAVSNQNEESAFSKEVAVTVGDPGSSTAPLLLGTLGANLTAPKNPVATKNGDAPVPGETGIPSTLALLLLASAVIGTVLASRRQFAVHNMHPQS